MSECRHQDWFDAKVVIEPYSDTDYRFRVFDKVLVRNSLATDWHPAFFARYGGDKDRPYQTLTGEYWAYCVLFMNNEDLLLEWEGCRREYPDGEEFEPFDRVFMCKGKTGVWEPKHYLYRYGADQFFDFEGNPYGACMLGEPEDDGVSLTTGFECFEKVLVRYRNTHRWEPDFFAKGTRGKGTYFTIYKNLEWPFCIPYKGNEQYLDCYDSKIQ